MFSEFESGISGIITGIAPAIVAIIELIGVIIIVVSVVKYVYKGIFVYKLNMEKIHEDKAFNVSLSVALEVLLASEILKTLMIKGDFNDLIEIVLLIIVRLLMSVTLRFEKKA